MEFLLILWSMFSGHISNSYFNYFFIIINAHGQHMKAHFFVKYPLLLCRYGKSFGCLLKKHVAGCMIFYCYRPMCVHLFKVMWLYKERKGNYQHSGKPLLSV